MFGLKKLSSRFDDAALSFREIRRTARTFEAVMIDARGAEKIFSREDLTGSLTPEQERARGALKIAMIDGLAERLADPENTGRLSTPEVGGFLIRMTMRSDKGSFHYTIDRADFAANQKTLRDIVRNIRKTSDKAEVIESAIHNLEVLSGTLKSPGFLKSAINVFFD